MAFQISPSVVVTETDLTSIIPAVSVSNGATVGQFAWGPVEEIQTISSEDDLANQFGKPNAVNYKDWFSAANFLAYASNLQIVRVTSDALAKNATASASIGTTGQLIKNQEAYSATNFGSSTNLWIAKYPGVLGNSVGVAWADSLGYSATDSNGDLTWVWHDAFDSAPESDEFHIVVYDVDGKISGVPLSILEKYAFVSTDPTAKSYDGTTAYFASKINTSSAWLYVGKASLFTGTSVGIMLAGGADGAVIAEGDRIRGFGLFTNPEASDVSLVFAGGGGVTSSTWIIQNLAEVRKDCLALVSVQETDVVGVTDETTALTNVSTTRNSYGSSSYAVMDSAYKWQYDRYNDVNRWLPLNGDIAGLCANTDTVADPWFSPAGFNRGRIKNAIKLSSIQTQTMRDNLYKIGINPCATFPIEGPVLFGDKTLQSRPSAFDRINVRRLFIVLEKAIATSAKYMLFEQNDDYSRTNFVNTIEPYLKDVLGRRGITDYRVVCDTTNNTPDIIDANQFVASIFIKPTRSINFIQLNFVAVRTGVDFDEVVQGATV